MMLPSHVRNLFRAFLSSFSATFAFGWTFLWGIVLGTVLLGDYSQIAQSEISLLTTPMAYLAQSKVLGSLLCIAVGSIPWIPLAVEKWAAHFTEELFSTRVSLHYDFHVVNKLLAERRRWEAMEELEVQRIEKPDDPDLLFKIAETAWVELGDVRESRNRYEALWEKVKQSNPGLLGEKTRAISIATRLADIRYLSRDFTGARRALEEVRMILGRDLREKKDMVADRIESLKTLEGMRPTSLILFDIDGTLALSGGAGGKAVAAAFKEVYGRTIDLATIDFRGRTDISLWREMLTGKGLSYMADDPFLEEFKKKYIEHLRRMLVKSNPQTTPGAKPLLERLEREPSVALGLLTGNIEPGGRSKLQVVDINRFFPVGGFGEDGEDRAEIAAEAVQRSEEFYRTRFAKERTYVVGDAAPDIDAARAIGARSIAVATGWTPKEELMSRAPEFLLDDLRQSRAFLDAVGIKEPEGHRLSALQDG